MLPLIATTFLASLLGSMHCAGMCGAFVALAVMPMPGDDARPPTPRGLTNAAYNAGRLITYTLLGGLAGLLGSATNHLAVLAGVGQVAAALAGGTLVVFGLSKLLLGIGVRVPTPRLPEAWVRLVGRGHGLAAGMHPVYRAVSIGMLTTFLPCGWLYAFAVTAAGTGNPVHGAITMSVFWLGTLPVMAALGAGVKSLAGPLGSRLPAASCAAMIIVGLFTIAGRTVIHPASRGPAHSPGEVLCNDR